MHTSTKQTSTSIIPQGHHAHEQGQHMAFVSFRIARQPRLHTWRPALHVQSAVLQKSRSECEGYCPCAIAFAFQFLATSLRMTLIKWKSGSEREHDVWRTTCTGAQVGVTRPTELLLKTHTDPSARRATSNFRGGMKSVSLLPTIRALTVQISKACTPAFLCDSKNKPTFSLQSSTERRLPSTFSAHPDKSLHRLVLENIYVGFFSKRKG